MTGGQGPGLPASMNELALQVTEDNVLKLHGVLARQAVDLETYLRRKNGEITMLPLGNDPVSQDAMGRGSFGGKVLALLDVHWKHLAEVKEATALLKSIARNYGFTEDDVTAVFRQTESAK